MSQSTPCELNRTHSETAENQHTSVSATADGGSDPTQWAIDGKRAAAISTLTSLGIDAARAAVLLEEFDDIDEVFAADRAELAAITGVGPVTVEKITAATTPVTVHVRLGQGGLESIEEAVARDDTPEDSVAEWMQRAVRQRMIREFWTPAEDREGDEWGGEQ